MAYEQGILKSRHINKIQRWALSYWLWYKKKQKIEEKNEDWKGLLYLHKESVYEAQYNSTVPLDEVIDVEQLPLEPGLDDPMEVEAFLHSIDGQKQILESQLVHKGEWV
jgi:hypothetical protein